MGSKPIALGYLRRDISGPRQEWDRYRIRGLASRLGYSMARIVIFTAVTEHPIDGLIAIAKRSRAEAVILPSLDHLDGSAPATLVAVVDLITVDPHETFARWIIPPDAPCEMRIR